MIIDHGFIFPPLGSANPAFPFCFLYSYTVYDMCIVQVRTHKSLVITSQSQRTDVTMQCGNMTLTDYKTTLETKLEVSEQTGRPPTVFKAVRGEQPTNCESGGRWPLAPIHHLPYTVPLQYSAPPALYSVDHYTALPSLYSRQLHYTACPLGG